MICLLRRLLRDQSGGPILEYALVTALFGLACIVGFGVVSTSANGSYNKSTSGMMSIQESPLPTCAPSGCP